MPLFRYKTYQPQIGKNVFIAPNANVIGRVSMGENSNIWFGSVARGDVQQITIGENTNVQDQCMLHVVEEQELYIGKNVSIGHSVTLHACRVEDSCLIGMGSIVLDNVIIGEKCLVAAGSVVTPGKIFPAGSFIMGTPARLVRPLKEEEMEVISNHYKSYVSYKNEYMSDDFELII